MKQIWMLISWIGVVIFLWKCGWIQGREMQNIEERDCATVLYVDEIGDRFRFLVGVAREKKVGEQSLVERFSEWEEEDTKQLCEQYALTTGKSLSLAHLKVIIVSEAALKEAVILLDQDLEIAKTCPLLMADDNRFEECFEQYGKEAEYPVGLYLENVMKRTKQSGGRVPWLLDYGKWLRGDGSVQPCRIQKTEKGYVIAE